jgi:hypothetical protein
MPLNNRSVPRQLLYLALAFLGFVLASLAVAHWLSGSW